MKIFKNLTVCAIAGLFLTGCKTDDIPASVQEIEPHVQFHLTMSSGTRAADDWGGNYTGDTGEDFDKIVNDLTVVLYAVDAQGKIIKSLPVGELDKSTITKTQDSNNKHIWTIDGVLDLAEGYSASMLERGNYRLAVFANGTITNTKNPATSTFSIHGIPGVNGFNYVPMYGVAKADFSGLNAVLSGEGDKTFTLMNGDSPLEIPMLRSLAEIKVRVLASLYDGQQEVRLKNIQMNRHSEKGYIVPNKWDAVATVGEIKRSESLYVYTDHFSEGCKAIYATDDDETDPNNSREIRFFIPDTYNLDNDTDHIEEGEELAHGGEELKLTVIYEVNGEERTGYIYFRDYSSDGQLVGASTIDIVRNHIYEYTITGVADNFNLECEVSIQKWGYHRIETEL